MTRGCLLLLAGALGAQHIRVAPDVGACYAAFVLAGLMFLHPRARAAALLLFGATLFVVAAQGVVEQRLTPRFAGDSLLARVRIVDFPVRRDSTVTLIVAPEGDRRLPPRARVTWFEPPVTPAVGEVWEFELRLRRPRGNSNPGGFDTETWMLRERLHASGYVVGGPRNRLLWAGTATRLQVMRARFVAQATAAAESDAAAAVLAAIGVGARHLVSREQWDRFARTGTTHLMAISGLHVGLAAGAAFFAAFALLACAPGRRNAFVAASVVAVTMAAAYAIVSGFGVPARRALAMLVIVAFALLRRRQPGGPRTLALAAAVVFVTDPVAALAPGYHLSFAAVACLLWLAQRRVLRAPASLAERFRLRCGQLVTMQVFLLFGLMPLTSQLFQRVVPWSVPVNLLAVPVFSLLTVPLTLAGLVVGLAWERAALVLLGAAAATIDALEALTRRVAGWPWADLASTALSGPGFLLLAVPLAWVLLPRGWPGRGVAMLGALALVTWRPSGPPAACVDLWALDVGQGLAAVVRTQRHTLLFDTGMAWRGGGSAAEQFVVPFLRSQGVRRIDWLVVSHNDLDHAGGIGTILQNVPVGQVLTGEAPEHAGTPSKRCRRGQRWRVDGVAFSVLHPESPARHEGNNASCVLRISAGRHALLLTGDIESEVERSLVRRRARLAADIAVVPHHGSATSSTRPFVDAVSAAIAVVPAGHANQWGFPKPVVVERWNRSGAVVLDTAAAGAVAIRLCAAGGVVRLERDRERRRRFWHEP
ncbi:MAG TPA: DNA internalization-related competence protein ComEC/Rec2 [Woeseiaceae bacterium]